MTFCFCPSRCNRRFSRCFGLHLLVLHAQDFFVATTVDPAAIDLREELTQHCRDLGHVAPHADQASHLCGVVWQCAFAQVVQVKHPAISQVFQQIQVGCMGGVVADVKGVVIDDGLLDRASSMKLALLR